MQRGLVPDVVVLEGAPVLEELAREDEALLVGGDALPILDPLLDVVDHVRDVRVQCERLARQRLHEDLHTGLGGGLPLSTPSAHVPVASPRAAVSGALDAANIANIRRARVAPQGVPASAEERRAWNGMFSFHGPLQDLLLL